MLAEHLLGEAKFVSLDAGAYATIFVDRDAGRVVKLFRRGDDAAHTSKVYQSELRAYEIVQSCPELCAVTPAFYGARSVAGVITRDGRDISAAYHIDFGLEMELVPYPFVKIASVQGSQELRGGFHARGIQHTIDASVATTGDGTLRVIDFATEYFEVWHKPLL